MTAYHTFLRVVASNFQPFHQLAQLRWRHVVEVGDGVGAFSLEGRNSTTWHTTDNERKRWQHNNDVSVCTPSEEEMEVSLTGCIYKQNMLILKFITSCMTLVTSHAIPNIPSNAQIQRFLTNSHQAITKLKYKFRNVSPNDRIIAIRGTRQKLII